MGINTYMLFIRNMEKGSRNSEINTAEIAKINNRGRLLGMIHLKGFRFGFSSWQDQVYFFSSLAQKTLETWRLHKTC